MATVERATPHADDAGTAHAARAATAASRRDARDSRRHGRAGAASPPRVRLIGDSTLAAVRWYGSSQQHLAGLDYVLDAQSCRAVTAR